MRSRRRGRGAGGDDRRPRRTGRRAERAVAVGHRADQRRVHHRRRRIRAARRVPTQYEGVEASGHRVAARRRVGGRRQDVVRRHRPTALAARLRRLRGELPARAPAPVSRRRRRRARRDPLAAETRAGRLVPHRSQEGRRVRRVGGCAPGGTARHSRPRIAHEGFARSVSRSRGRARWTSPSRATRTRR